MHSCVELGCTCGPLGAAPATDARSAEVVHARQRRDAPTEPASSRGRYGAQREGSTANTHLYRISWHTPHVMASSMCLSSVALVFVRTPACSTAGGTTSCMGSFLEACARNSQHAEQVRVHSAYMYCTQSTLGSRKLPLILSVIHSKCGCEWSRAPMLTWTTKQFAPSICSVPIDTVSPAASLRNVPR